MDLALPVQLEKDDIELSNRIIVAHPKAVAAIEEYKRVYGTHVDAYRTLCIALRAEALGPRELTLLLLAEGWAKSRASEISAIVLSDDKTFEAYQARLIGFKAALAEQRSMGRIVAGLVETGKAYSAVVNALNSIDLAVFVQKRAKFRCERLGVVYTLVVRRKAQKAARKGKKGHSHAVAAKV